MFSSDGGSPEPVTAREIQETDPTWSQDGKALAFGHINASQPEQTFIELFDVATRKISQLPGSLGLFGSRGSLDGRYVVALNSDNTKLMLCDVKAGKCRQLSVGPNQTN
ncbi:MAG: hypothetical protein WB755_14495 [Terriglobales bacterium]